MTTISKFTNTFVEYDVNKKSVIDIPDPNTEKNKGNKKNAGSWLKKKERSQPNKNSEQKESIIGEVSSKTKSKSKEKTNINMKLSDKVFSKRGKKLKKNTKTKHNENSNNNNIDNNNDDDDDDMGVAYNSVTESSEEDSYDNIKLLVGKEDLKDYADTQQIDKKIKLDIEEKRLISKRTNELHKLQVKVIKERVYDLKHNQFDLFKLIRKE